LRGFGFMLDVLTFIYLSKQKSALVSFSACFADLYWQTGTSK